jgi:hypothetical protein
MTQSELLVLGDMFSSFGVLAKHLSMDNAGWNKIISGRADWARADVVIKSSVNQRITADTTYPGHSIIHLTS